MSKLYAAGGGAPGGMPGGAPGGGADAGPDVEEVVSILRNRPYELI